MKRPDLVVANYEATEFVRRNIEHLRELRKALAFIEPSAYRGISREPLMPYPSTDLAVVDAFAKSGGHMGTERQARRRARELIGEIRVLEDDDDLLDTEDQLREVWGLLDDPAGYETVQLRRDEYLETANTLGFDVGYWGGDHFSIIADSAVTPIWHPPDPKDHVALAAHLRVLNNNVLFVSQSAAIQFKEWYTSRPWAETESTARFEVIQVIAIPGSE